MVLRLTISQGVVSILPPVPPDIALLKNPEKVRVGKSVII